jgi:hypothetical protein
LLGDGIKDSTIVTLFSTMSPAGGTPLAAGSGLKSAPIALTAVSRPSVTSPNSEYCGGNDAPLLPVMMKN